MAQHLHLESLNWMLKTKCAFWNTIVLLWSLMLLLPACVFLTLVFMACLLHVANGLIAFYNATCNVNFLCGSVTVKCAYSFRYQKCAGIHWFKYYYLHKSAPCSEDFGRFDGASYADWGLRSRLFSSSGAVWFLQVCTRNETGLKRYLLLILCNILIFCTGK